MKELKREPDEPDVEWETRKVDYRRDTRRDEARLKEIRDAIDSNCKHGYWR